MCFINLLILEFRDAVSEGDGARVYRCWRVMLPHFLASRRTKGSLEALQLQPQVEALRLLSQVEAILPPYLAHGIASLTVVTQNSGLVVYSIVCVRHINVGVNDSTLLDYLVRNVMWTCISF